MSKATEYKEKLIEYLMDTKYVDDSDQYYQSNLEYIEQFSIEVLEDMATQYGFNLTKNELKQFME